MPHQKKSHFRSCLLATATLCFVSALLGGMDAFASTTSTTTSTVPAATTGAPLPPPGGGAPPSTRNSALDAAMSACAASVAKDTHGGPDRTAMDACLKQKGFTLPQQGAGGPPPQGAPGAGGPPPQGSSGGGGPPLQGGPNGSSSK